MDPAPATPLLASWQFWALLAAASAALTAVFAKIGVTGLDPDLATFIRTGVVLAFLAGMLTVLGKWHPPTAISARSWLFLLLSGLATGLSWLCYFRALSLGEAGKVAPLDKLSVVMVAVFGFVFLGERLSALGWLGIALIAIGAVLVAWKA